MTNEKLAQMLQTCLNRSITAYWDDDDIHPSIHVQYGYDGYQLATQVQALIDFLRLED